MTDPLNDDLNQLNVPLAGNVPLAVIQHQVIAMQTAFDRGLGGLERTVERGFGNLGSHLERIEGRLKTVEERQAVDTARLQALEEHRSELDRRDQHRQDDQRRELAAARESVNQAKTIRLLIWLAVSGTAIAGGVATVIAVIHG